MLIASLECVSGQPACSWCRLRCERQENSPHSIAAMPRWTFLTGALSHSPTSRPGSLCLLPHHVVPRGAAGSDKRGTRLHASRRACWPGAGAGHRARGGERARCSPAGQRPRAMGACLYAAQPRSRCRGVAPHVGARAYSLNHLAALIAASVFTADGAFPPANSRSVCGAQHFQRLRAGLHARLPLHGTLDRQPRPLAGSRRAQPH
jgi:hypothetical protein